MTINKNTFTDILSLPEWDDKILELLEYLKEERPVVEKGEIDCFITSEKYGIQILFDDDCTTPVQIAMEADSNLYANQISFNKDTTLSLPFDIKYGDDYKTIVSKIGRETDVPAEYMDDNCGWGLGGKEKPYWLSCTFEDENMNSLNDLFIRIQLPYKFD